MSSSPSSARSTPRTGSIWKGRLSGVARRRRLRRRLRRAVEGLNGGRRAHRRDQAGHAGRRVPAELLQLLRSRHPAQAHPGRGRAGSAQRESVLAGAERHGGWLTTSCSIEPISTWRCERNPNYPGRSRARSHLHAHPDAGGRARAARDRRDRSHGGAGRRRWSVPAVWKT